MTCVCSSHSISLSFFVIFSGFFSYFDFLFSCLCHSEKLSPGQHVMVDLYLASGNQKQRSEARYSMTAVDLQHSSAKNGKFAIFIVPQGECYSLQKVTISF